MSIPNGAPGLQNERTALAWNRTALSLLAAGAAITRLAYPQLGLWSLVCLGLVGPLTIWVFWLSRARYRHSAECPRPHIQRDGVAALSLTLVTAVIGLTELAAALLT